MSEWHPRRIILPPMFLRISRGLLSWRSARKMVLTPTTAASSFPSVRRPRTAAVMPRGCLQQTVLIAPAPACRRCPPLSSCLETSDIESLGNDHCRYLSQRYLSWQINLDTSNFFGDHRWWFHFTILEGWKAMKRCCSAILEGWKAIKRCHSAILEGWKAIRMLVLEGSL